MRRARAMVSLRALSQPAGLKPLQPVYLQPVYAKMLYVLQLAELIAGFVCFCTGVAVLVLIGYGPYPYYYTLYDWDIHLQEEVQKVHTDYLNGFTTGEGMWCGVWVSKKYWLRHCQFEIVRPNCFKHHLNLCSISDFYCRTFRNCGHKKEGVAMLGKLSFKQKACN